MKSYNSLKTLNKSITECNLCTRLRKHCLKIALTKKRSFAQETYWGKPVTGFGDPNASIVIVGLAPAAHGANRTGRIFTGDNSGLWLYRALHKAGLANQAESVSLNDGLVLKKAYVTCSVRCAPPDNKPTPQEFKNCSPYLKSELDLLTNKKVIIALGSIAAREVGNYLGKKIKFTHGNVTALDDITVICSYHPSQQNTFTKRLTEPMFDKVFERAILLA